MAKIISLAGVTGQSSSERNKALFDWALTVLKQVGAVDRIVQARTIAELQAVTLDTESAEIALAIRDALHPVTGVRATHFGGLREGSLKKILKNQFADLKRYRERDLRGASGGSSWQADWSDGLIRKKDGSIVVNLANITLILEKAPVWEGVLGFDEFRSSVVIRKAPPWGSVPPGTLWTDHFEALTRVWFQKTWLNPTQGDLGRAVQTAARANPFHPVKEYFDGLVWDGVSRLEAWLVTYFGAEDTAYIRAIGPRYLTSACARVYQPGCQVDHMIVLEGEQGTLKSTALRTLAIKDSWFADRLSHLASKDAALEVAGILIVEVAEMDALARASSSTAKSFITRRHDRFRHPYSKHTSSLARQCVFAGSINPPVGGYLRDPTGARRFWPVTCGEVIDLAALERDRDQLWGEAVAQYKAGSPWWLETPKLEALATAEQAARFVADVWESQVREWLGKDKLDVSIEQVLEDALGFKPDQWTQSSKQRVSKILTHLGFRLVMGRKGGRHSARQKRYRREPESVRR